MLSLIDCYDEFTCRHAYHASLTPDEAAERIKAGAGSQFDPRVAEAFGEVAEGFANIAQRYADSDKARGLELQRLEDAVTESIELTPPEP